MLNSLTKERSILEQSNQDPLQLQTVFAERIILYLMYDWNKQTKKKLIRRHRHSTFMSNCLSPSEL